MRLSSSAYVPSGNPDSQECRYCVFCCSGLSQLIIAIGWPPHSLPNVLAIERPVDYWVMQESEGTIKGRAHLFCRSTFFADALRPPIFPLPWILGRFLGFSGFCSIPSIFYAANYGRPVAPWAKVRSRGTPSKQRSPPSGRYPWKDVWSAWHLQIREAGATMFFHQPFGAAMQAILCELSSSINSAHLL